VHRSHAAVGAALVVLLVMSVGLRIVLGKISAAGPAERRWSRVLAGMAHVSLWSLLLALSSSGFLAMYVSRSAAPIHLALVYAGLALAGLHAAAALWHQAVLRDGTLTRMLPGSRSAR